MKALLVRFVREDEGQDLVGYALLLALVALAAITAMVSVRHRYQQQYRARLPR